MSEAFGEKMWEPGQENIKNTEMTLFKNFVNEKSHLSLKTWIDLYNWSIEETEDFWELLHLYTKILWQRKPNLIYKAPKKGKMLGAKWFEGASLNFAENMLRPLPLEEVVVTAYLQEKQVASRTGAELWRNVSSLAKKLKALGLKKGDRTSAVVTNSIETLELMLAVTSAGGIWSSCSPDFGAQGLLDRLSLIKPKFLFCHTSYSYKDKSYDISKSIESCSPAFTETIAFISLGKKEESTQWAPQKTFFYEDLVKQTQTEEKFENSLDFEALSFSDPLYIMFSSGTTGKPKCIIHSVGGTLLQHKKELMLHCNLKKSETLMFYTSCSWMMWNWMVSSLSVGGKLVLYEGSPSYPNPLSYWKIAQKEKVKVLGTSPAYLSYCQKNKDEKLPNLPHLKCLLSTGAPLLPEHYSWVYQKLKQDLHLASISGGTDIISCFVLGNPNLPVHSGEIQGAGLGMAVEVKSENSQGELVCTKPFVSMPIGFLHDPEGKKYYESYFSCYKDEIWKHGDHVEETKNKGFIIHGRSDATLNPNGVRMGTSEFYNCLEGFDELEDTLVAAQKTQLGDKIILFILTKKNTPFTRSLEEKITKRIETSLTKRHRPTKIFPIKEIPKTHNGKKLEILVSSILNSKKIDNLGSVANPSCLDEIYLCKKSLHENLEKRAH